MLENKLNKTFLLLDQALVSGSNFTISFLITKALGIEELGMYAMVWALVLVVSGVAQSFLIKPFQTFWGKLSNECEKKDYRSFLFGFLGVTSITLLALSFIIYTTSDYRFISIVGLTLSSFLFHDFLRKYLIVVMKFKLLLLLDIVGYLPVLFVVDFVDSIEIVLLYQAGFFGFSFFGLFGISQFRNWGEFVRKHWMFSRWLLAGNMTQWLSGNLYILIGGWYVSIAAVGIVKLGQTVFGVFNVLILIFENYLPAKVSETYISGGKHELLIELDGLKTKVNVVFIVLSSIIVFFSERIIQVLFGDSFVQYYWVFPFFVGIYFFIIQTLFLRLYFRTIENTKTLFQSYSWACILNGLAAFPLMYWLGEVGMLIGMLLTQIIFWIDLKFNLNQIYHENNTLSTR
tara:strand:- start:604 stop:1809 length:1206 start_codon:yes stop_codon:yes gene_type:complete